MPPRHLLFYSRHDSYAPPSPLTPYGGIKDQQAECKVKLSPAFPRSMPLWNAIETRNLKLAAPHRAGRPAGKTA